MDDDVIEEIADAFAGEIRYIEEYFDGREQERFIEIVLYAVHALAVVIHNHEPTYDLRHYYRRAGWVEPYPVHPID